MFPICKFKFRPAMAGEEAICRGKERLANPLQGSAALFHGPAQASSGLNT